MKTINQLKHIGRNIRPGGGPSGYLYNLNRISTESSSTKIGVYALKVSHDRSGPASQEAKGIILNAPYIFRKWFAKTILYVRGAIDILLIFKIKLELGDNFPVFHDQMLAFIYGVTFKKKYGLMPHQPIELAQEVDDLYRLKYNLKPGDVYEIVVKKEIIAYNNAAFFITPTEYSLDGYFISNVTRKASLDKIRKHIVISTVKKPKPTLDRFAARQALGLCSDSIAIGFMGRYIMDKGYDLFVNMAKAHSENTKLHFFSAGAGVIDCGSSNVKDLGWRKDIADIISAMDLIVIPNRVTYFDLLPIECLMLGTPVAVTAVGGNKWLLSESNDSNVQEIIFNLMEGGDNLDSIIKQLPSRVDFKNSSLAVFFNDNFFVNSHEAVMSNIQDSKAVR